MTSNIIPGAGKDISEYGVFPLSDKQKTNDEVVFVSKETGYVEKTELELMIEAKVQIALQNLITSTEGLIVLDGNVYVGGDRLVKEKEIFA